ncbi:hypothetical protein GGI20_002917 [Coemansia sp. BCRC 34301]|nr:hypothetical protein GGI20_002917 [Coemansia sp. BCRC 34301]
MLSSAIDDLAGHVLGLLRSGPRRRLIVAVAGVAGSGKSFVSHHVTNAINAAHASDIAVVVPMDGYHHPRATLRAMVDPDLALRRRGAPWTFDANGFVAAVEAIRNDDGERVLVAGFDHAVGDPVAGAIAVEPWHRVVVVEGLYAHVGELPWSRVGLELADELWWIEPEDAEASRERLVQRHVVAGLAADRKGAEERISGNDDINGEYAKTTRLAATRTILN